MLKKGDEVMFFFIKSHGGVTSGKGSVHEIRPSAIHVSWFGDVILSLDPNNVYPYDNDRYIEMCDTHAYRSKITDVHVEEISRLQKICEGEHNA